jgi:hypothetical protein
MFGLKRKLGIKVMVILLFSVFILLGLNITQAYGQPLDSPLYSHTKTKAVESMNTPAEANNSSADANGPVSSSTSAPPTCEYSLCVHEEDTSGPGWTCAKPAGCPVQRQVLVMSAAGELVYILTLTGGACWAILKKK